MIKIYTDLNQILTLQKAYAKDGRRLIESDLSLIENGAVVFDENEILWVGSAKDLPTSYKFDQKISLKDHVLVPEIVDSHTHVVFGGDRAQEYAERLSGIPYEEIAKRGGGILFTMKETNNSSSDELFNESVKKIEQIASYGVGTIEVKSGYGLSFDKELEISLMIDRLKKYFHPKIQIFNTYLAAHDIPQSFSSSSDYLDKVVVPLLEKLAPLKIIDAVDIFHEKNYFNERDAKKLFQKASDLGIARKIHADELNSNGGAELAADYQALSADHLLRISDQGISKLAQSKTVATLLPGTAFFLGKPLGPARKMLDAGVKVAVASDFNPGSCHCDNLLLIGSISAAQLKMTQVELWAAMTLNASHALGKCHQGAIAPKMKPRFTLFKAQSLSHITYNWGKNLAVNLP